MDRYIADIQEECNVNTSHTLFPCHFWDLIIIIDGGDIK